MKSFLLSTSIVIYVLTYAINSTFSAQDMFREPVEPVFSSVLNSWEHMGVESPSILFDSMYKMWYSGTDASNKKRIGYATSPDGILWTRFGNNHCASQLTGNGCVLDVGNKMSWDGDQVYGMSVVMDPAAPASSRYKMWHTGANNASALKNGRWRTGYAFSSDGVIWTKFKGNKCTSNSNAGSCVFDTGAPGSWDEIVAAAPSVIIDADASPTERYKMWYEGCIYSDNVPEHICRIGYATSPDGINWTRYKENRCTDFSHGKGCVLDTGKAGNWDDVRLVHPVVIKTEHKYEMWYAGQSSADHKFRIGYALSSDGIQWERYEDNNCNSQPGNGCVFDVDVSGSKSGISDPAMIQINGTRKIWYRATGTTFGLKITIK